MIFTATPSLWEKLLDQPLDRRIAPAPAEMVDFVAQYNAASGNPSRPCAARLETDFRADLCQAIVELPPPVKRKLEPRLLGLFFMANVGSPAVMDMVARSDGDLIGAIVVIDVNILSRRKANEWVTWKENTPFLSAPGFHVEAYIAEQADDNRKSALQYFLLHEFGHILAAGLDFIPDCWQNPSSVKQAGSYSFLPLSWGIGTDGTVAPLAKDDFPLRRKVVYYSMPQLAGTDIPVVFRDLERTAFPTLHAATSVHEDFAECFSTYVHTVMLGKRHEINVYQNGKLAAAHSGFWTTARSREKADFFSDFFNQPASPLCSHRRHVQGSRANTEVIEQAETAFLGLAPFLRISLAGGDLKEIAQELLDRAGRQQENANLWMNLSTALFSNKLRDAGLSVQAQALIMQRTYRLPSTGQTGKFKLLMLMAPGDLGQNTPLDCLLQGSNIDLIFYYATDAAPLPINPPAHDALFIAIGESERTLPLLKQLESLLADWDKPVIDAPQHIPNTERCTASKLLQDVPGLIMPPTWQISREALEAISRDAALISDLFDGCRFPIIVRPVGSHAGRDLARIDDTPGTVDDYLSQVQDASFYVSNFIDYRGEDGLFRKYRIVLIAGQPFPCHMAVGSHWMIHYVNAGMYEDAAKRAEEASFIESFAGFALRHAGAFEAVYQRSKLDYVCIDCCETRDGQLLIFEIGHTMVVHAMDAEEMFPFKQAHMRKVRNAFEEFLLSPWASSPVLSTGVIG